MKFLIGEHQNRNYKFGGDGGVSGDEIVLV